jgi:cytochrome P450
VMLMTHAGMFDAEIFQRPTELRADRPATSYLHYGAGIHACAGAALSNLQVPMLVRKLLERDFRATGKLNWSGPFPNSLPVTVEAN